MSSQRTILIVDDSDFDRLLLVQALKRRGEYEILQAATGAAALQLIAERPVGLVLLDMMMPDMNGMEILRTIRRQFNAIQLPVIMVTANADVLSMIECLQNGANDYITKPVLFDVAVTRISIHFEIGDLSRQAGELKQLAAVAAMIATFSHEINNPLAIALGCLSLPDKDMPAHREKLKKALERIAEIVKEISHLRERGALEFETYAGSIKMVKLK